MGKNKREKTKRKRTADLTSPNSPDAPTTSKKQAIDPASPDQPASTCNLEEEPFQTVSTKKRNRRAVFRPRLHPATSVNNKKDLYRDPNALTILFRPVDPTTSLHSRPSLDLSQAFASLPATPIGWRKIRNGGLALDFTPSSDRTALLSIVSLASVKVKAALPIIRKNACGTIRGDYSCAEEVHELYLAHEENPRVENIIQLGKTNVFKLIFASNVMPDRVKIFYNFHRVQAYFQHPTRCYKCHRFNHVSETCRSTDYCLHCGLKGKHENCERPARCVNCGGPHPASDRSCSHRIFELRVQKHRVSTPSTIGEARISVAATYAEALKRASCSISGPRSEDFSPPSQVGPSAAENKSSDGQGNITTPIWKIPIIIQRAIHSLGLDSKLEENAARTIIQSFKDLLNIDLGKHRIPKDSIDDY